MSFFDWLSRKNPAPVSDSGVSSGLGQTDATQPLFSNARPRPKAAVAATHGASSSRRAERLERREQLYTVVRECMTQAGVLSSKYKFKVLSLDSKGRDYLVMIDLPRENAVEPERLTDIELLIARNAKNLHGILVTAVYWRLVEQVASNTQTIRTVTPASRPVVPEPLPAKVAVSVEPAAPRFEPLQDDEVAAFKKALASVPAGKVTPPPGEIIRSGRRNPAPMPHFADTELDDSHSPLSGTQYGDLN